MVSPSSPPFFDSFISTRSADCSTHYAKKSGPPSRQFHSESRQTPVIDKTVSRRDFLEKDAEGYRKPGDMVRLHFNYSQVKIAPSHLYAFFVDTRVYDGPLSADIILRLDEISKRMKTQKNVVRISASSLSCLIPAITGVNAFLKQRIPAGEVRAEYCPQLTEVNSITRTGREFIAGSTTIQLVFTK